MTGLDDRGRGEDRGTGSVVAAELGLARTQLSASTPRPTRLPRIFRIKVGQSLPGTPYRVLAPLAEGGMGQLYEVQHVELGRRCVLKALHERDRGRVELEDRLRDEARLLAELGGNVAPLVFDAGRLPDERPYFVMERLDGSDVAAELKRHRQFSVPFAVELMLKLLAALGVLHARGIVHRDLKLANLFLTRSGELKVLDLGIALDEAADLGRTGIGVALGTPRTMAPEQHAAKTADVRADLYAVGLALYELVTGSGPFDDLEPDHVVMAHAHRHRPPPPPSRYSLQAVPPAIEHVIERALRKDPRDRYASAAEMSAALHAAMVALVCEDEPTELDVFVTSSSSARSSTK